MRRDALYPLAIAASLVVVVSVALVMTRTTDSRPSARAGVPVLSWDLSERLAQAQERASYELRIPSWTPPGLELSVIEWLEDPDAPLGPTVSVDLVYEGRDDSCLHIWLTDIAAAELIAAGKDPVTSYGGAPIAVAGSQWIVGVVERPGGSLQTLSGRVGEITISIDGRYPVDDLRRVAESLTPLGPAD